MVVHQQSPVSMGVQLSQYCLLYSRRVYAWQNIGKTIQDLVVATNMIVTSRLAQG